MSARVRAGVDVGGTFTDLVCYRDGRLTTHKLPSTPPDYGQAVLAGLAHLAAEGLVVHGSTVATNALIERRGARCGLITTRGFRDVLTIGRQARPALYDLRQTRPEPLVPRALRLEVSERVAADGTILAALDPAEAAGVVEALATAGVESVAVCLLFSFVRPEHEQTLARMARERGLEVSVSCEILPEFREYERTVATVVNAYVGPAMRRYLDGLRAGLGGRSLWVMQSNGGCADAATAAREAVRTVLSGPAAGLVGAYHVGRVAGAGRLVSFDMGGTSTDVAFADDGLPLTTETTIAGLPLAVPALDIHTVGAGGGSIARVDPGGALTVGPASAGAEPGPACYGRGGGLPTVTDAHLTLGRLLPERFLGGRMVLDEAAAREAVGRLAAELGLGLKDGARGVIAVANVAMERALRVISIERGLDPRGATLVSFGGAGGLHAIELAERLGFAQVLVPPHPGTLSALGLLLAEVVRDGARTVMAPLERLTSSELNAWFEDLAEVAVEALRRDGMEAGRVERAMDLRYRGQSFELMRPCLSTEPAAIAADFHAAHERRYHFARPEVPIELVTLRVRAIAAVEPPEFHPSPLGDPDPREARIDRRPVVFEAALPTEVYDLERLRPGHRIEGPALLSGADTTVLIPPGWAGVVDGYGNLAISPEG